MSDSTHRPPPLHDGEPRRAYVETYGCQMNISDGELMEGVLQDRGYRIVEAPDEADVVLVNTCAIREHAEQRVLGRVAHLNQLKLERPELIIGVTGCMAQRMGRDLLERAPYVDLVMGPDGYRSLPSKIREVRARRNGEGPEPDEGSGPRPSRQLAVLDFDIGENYRGLEQRRTSRVSAWVPVQRGCDHRCTFCIVPYVRGPEKNRDPEAVLGEIRGIAASGITEVTLLGQTVNSYRHGEWGFPDLLKAVARVDGIRRVRFTSPHPNDVTRELVEVMAGEDAVCEHLHLPVQSGNDEILRRMVRRYTVAEFLEKVQMVRSAIPDVALSTDVIVGFPSETDDQFRDTLELMRDVRFDDAYTYKYSPREGTPATRMPEDWFVSEDVAQARLEELIEVSREIVAEINRSEVGRDEEVLVEKEARDEGWLLGRTRRNKVVHFPGERSLIGAYRRVTLEETTGATFAGREAAVPRTVAAGAS